MHWRTYLDSDVIRYVDLDGRDHVVQIDHVKRGKVTGTGGKATGKAMIYLTGRAKPIGAGAETLTQIGDIYGHDTTKWPKQWITIWPDPSVRYGGAPVGGVRVRRNKPTDAEITEATERLAEAEASKKIAPKETSK